MKQITDQYDTYLRKFKTFKNIDKNFTYTLTKNFTGYSVKASYNYIFTC